MSDLPIVERDGDEFRIRNGNDMVVYDKEGAIAVFLALGAVLKDYDQEKPSNGLDKSRS